MTVTGHEIYGQRAPGSECIDYSPIDTDRSGTTASITEPIRRRPTGDRELIRIASVPAEHVYVRHLNPVGDRASVVRLTDPAPLVDGAVAGQWWPPTMLTPHWIQTHHQDFDVFHIQFGFDAQEPAHLASVVEELRHHGKPLVYTVHDLRNPHHADRQAHDAHLDILIPQADKLITLTSGAADAVQQRWGRRPQVIAHPHVVDIDRMRAPIKRADDRFVVGIHAKSVRASMNPLAVIEALIPLSAQLPNLHLQVNIHHDVFDSAGTRHDRSLVKFLSVAAANNAIDLKVHHCFTDDELWAYLQSLDVSVLPYRFGTHSGWLEACYDLGTAVVAPTCGYFGEQRPCLSYVHDEDHFDGESLRAAVTRAYHERPSWRADPVQRAAERAQIAQAHLELYESLLR